MAIALAGATNLASLDLNSFSQSITVPSGSNRVLLVALQVHSNGSSGEIPSSVTWNGSEALTLLGEQAWSGAYKNIGYWYRINPTATTANLTAASSGGHSSNLTVWCGCAMTFTGVDTASPFGSFQSASGVEDGFSGWVVTGAAGDLIQASFGFTDFTDNNYNLAPTAPLVENFDAFTDSGGWAWGLNAGGATLVSDGSDTVGWAAWGTTGYQGRLAVPIHPAAAGGGSLLLPRRPRAHVRR